MCGRRRFYIVSSKNFLLIGHLKYSCHLIPGVTIKRTRNLCFIQQHIGCSNFFPSGISNPLDTFFSNSFSGCHITTIPYATMPFHLFSAAGTLHYRPLGLIRVSFRLDYGNAGVRFQQTINNSGRLRAGQSTLGVKGALAVYPSD